MTKRKWIAAVLLLALVGVVWAGQNIQGVVFPGNGTVRLPQSDAGSGTEAGKTTLYAAADGSLHYKPHGGADVALGAGSGDLTEIQVSGVGLSVTNGTGPIPSLALHARLQDVASITSMVKGDMLVWNGEKWTLVTGGTDEQLLTRETSAENGVQWKDAPAGGGTIDGSGTAAYLAVWSDSNTLADLGPPDDNSVPIGNGSAFVLESGATLRTSLGLAIGTNVQAWDEELDDVAGLTPTAAGVIIGNGSAFTVESGATLRSSIGLAIGLNVQAWDSDLDELAVINGSQGDLIYHNGTAWVRLPPGTDGHVLSTQGNDGNPQWIPPSEGTITEVTKTGSAIVVSGGTGPTVTLSAQEHLEDIAAITSAAADQFLGWTGSTALVNRTPAQVRTSLGLVIGTNVQAWSAQLDTLAGLTPGDGSFIVGNGTSFTTESGSTARTSLGLAIGTDVQEWDADLDSLAAISGVRGDLIFRGASGWTRLPAGTSGYLLSTQGDDADPQWIAPSEGGQFVEEVVETGNALTVTDGTGPTVTLSVQARLEDIASITTWNTHHIIMAAGETSLVNVAPADARTNLGLAIGTDVQAWSERLDDVAAVSPTADRFLGGDGSNLVMRSASQVRASINVGDGADLTAVEETGNGIIIANATGPIPSFSLQGHLEDVASITTASTNHILMWAGETALINVSPADARTNLGLAIGTDVQAWGERLDDVAAVDPTEDQFLGGDGSNLVMRTAAQVRDSLGLAETGDGSGDLTAIEETGNGIIITDGTGPIPSLTLHHHLEDIAAITSAAADQFLGFTGETALVNRTPAQVRTSLSLVVGTDVQAFDEELADIAGLSPTDNGVIIGNGSAFVLESGATLRTSIGLAIGTDVQAWDEELDDVAAVSPTADQFLGGNGSALVMRTAAQVRTSINVGDGADLTAVEETGNGIIIASGTGPIPSFSLQGHLEDIASITTAAANHILMWAGETALINVAPATARDNLGLEIGADVQAFDEELADIAGLSPTDNSVIIGNGSAFVLESGSTLRTSIGLAIGTDVQAWDAELDDVAGLTPGDGEFIVGDGSAFVTESGATARASLGLTIGTDVQAYDAQLDDFAALAPTKGRLAVADGTNWLPLTVGDDGQVLTADAAETLGVKWADAGGGSGTVNVTGSGLTGDGSAEAPLTLDAVLQEIVAHWTVGEDGDAELPSLLATSHLTIGSADPDGIRLEVNSGRLDVREGDDSAPADMLVGQLLIGNTNNSGWLFEPTAANTLTLKEGDDSDLSAGDGLDIGTTTGYPSLRARAGDASNPTYTFVTDTNTGMYRVASDSIGFAAGGAFRAGVDTSNFSSTVPFLCSAADSPNSPQYAFASDANTGLGRVEPDAPALAAEGRWRHVTSNAITLTDGVATNLFTIPLLPGERCGGIVDVYVLSTDGTDHNVVVRSFSFAAMDKGGTLSSNGAANAQVTAGAATGAFLIDAGPTFSIVDGTNSISVALLVGLNSTPTITCWFELRWTHSTAGVALSIP